MDPFHLTAVEMAARMGAGDLTSRRIVDACLERVAAREDTVGAWAFLDPDLARAQADAADELRAAGKATPLTGLPVGIKDIIDTADMPTECGSRLCAGRRPDKDATLVGLLRRAGAVIMGKTVTTEFALSAPGKTTNPHDAARTPGGSSSGSAAAVADFMVPLAIGSQTGGSMLRPASYCGVYGFKPTFATISRAGMSPLSRRLDHPGIYARAPEDVALAAAVLMRRDPADRDMRGHVRFDAAEPPTRTPRLAFVRGPVWDQGDGDMRAAIAALARDLGDCVTECDLPPPLAEAPACHGVIMNGAVAASLGPYFDRDAAGLDPVTRERIERGLGVTARDYLTALEQAEDMQAALDGFFRDFDAVLTPASPGQAPRDLRRTGSAVFNGYWTLMGVPAVSVPVLRGADGMPIGVQLVGPRGDDGEVLALARWLADRVGEQTGGGAP